MKETRKTPCSWLFLALIASACGGNVNSRPSRGPAPATTRVGEAEQGRQSAGIMLTPEQSKRNRPWGPTVPDAKELLLVKDLLGRVASGDQAASDCFFDPFIVGPAMWATLKKVDAAARGELGDLGRVSHSKVKLGSGAILEQEMRTFEKEDHEVLRKTTVFRATARLLERGVFRAATEDERQLFYRLVPFDTYGQPLTVIETNGDRTVVVTSEGKLFWIEILSAWKSDTPRSD